MNLLLRLQREFGLAYIVIAHDLAVVLHMSSRVAVMYVGNIVEAADSAELYAHPAHPYTKALFAAAFQHKAIDFESFMLPGEVASPLNRPQGCPFNPRCPHAMKVCSEVQPELKDTGSGHEVACWL
jgi:oligopeptide/dipeptide ABC transporter ATP-binding protein